MAKVAAKSTGHNSVQHLAMFRREIRRFLQYSEEAAGEAGLLPQQHQMLLQIAGAAAGEPVTLKYMAEVLGLRRHTVVELSKRCEKAGLVRREHEGEDPRSVTLTLTAAGSRALRSLSDRHAEQLRELAPRLIQALTRIAGEGKRQGLGIRE